MDYPRYLANGWQIGSGPVESACKTVVANRLKGSGMRWGEDGSDASATSACCTSVNQDSGNRSGRITQTNHKRDAHT